MFQIVDKLTKKQDDTLSRNQCFIGPRYSAGRIALYQDIVVLSFLMGASIYKVYHQKL